MEKHIKLLWRYFGAILVLVEIAAYFILIQNPFPWQFVRLAFMLVNSLIVAYLVQIKLKVEKHNAQIGGATEPKKSQITFSQQPTM